MWLVDLFRRKKSETADCSMKYLIVGLGNIGGEYVGTRHNVGFRIIDAFAKKQNAEWTDKRYGAIAKTRVKNAELILNQTRYIPTANHMIISITLVLYSTFSLALWYPTAAIEKKHIDPVINDII